VPLSDTVAIAVCILALPSAHCRDCTRSVLGLSLLDNSRPNIRRVDFAADSPLEGAGFEPSVPLAKEGRAQAWNSPLDLTRRILRA